MKIVVLNIASNVGKSTVARYLAPRLGVGSQVFSVGFYASSRHNAYRGIDFDNLILDMTIVNDVVVDVDVSQLSCFINSMHRQRGSHQDFDFFIIPTLANKKQISETILTIEKLHKIGVEKSRIRVIFNRVDLSSDVIRDIQPFIKHPSTSIYYPLSCATLEENEFFSRAQGASINEVLADTTDYKALIKSAESTEDKLSLAGKITVRRLAHRAKDQLDAVFNSLAIR